MNPISRITGTLCVIVSASFGFSATLQAADPPAKPLKALLVLGGCCHDYAKQKDILKEGIEKRAHVQVDIIYTPDKTTRAAFEIYEKADWAKGYDVVIHDECSADIKDAETIQRILAPHAAGLAAVVLHCAMHSYRTEGWNTRPPAITPWFAMTGLPSTGHGPQQPIALTFLDKENPITKGMEDWTTVNEELYNNAAGKVLDTARPLVRGKQGNTETIVAWTNTYKDKGRVFGTTIGHNNTTVGDERYLNLVTRGLLWACDKLNDSYLKPAPQKAAAVKRMNFAAASLGNPAKAFPSSVKATKQF